MLTDRHDLPLVSKENHSDAAGLDMGRDAFGQVSVR